MPPQRNVIEITSSPESTPIALPSPEKATVTPRPKRHHAKALGPVIEITDSESDEPTPLRTKPTSRGSIKRAQQVNAVASGSGLRTPKNIPNRTGESTPSPRKRLCIVIEDSDDEVVNSRDKGKGKARAVTDDEDVEVMVYDTRTMRRRTNADDVALHPGVSTRDASTPSGDDADAEDDITTAPASYIDDKALRLEPDIDMHDDPAVRATSPVAPRAIEDITADVTSQVLDVVPDINRAYLARMIAENMPILGPGTAEGVLEALFQAGTWPRVGEGEVSGAADASGTVAAEQNRVGKGKGRERAENNGAPAAKRARVDNGKGKARADPEPEEFEEGEGIECQCCFGEYAFDAMVQCPEAHLFCATCLSAYAGTQLGQQTPVINCMHASGCALPFPASELRRALPPTLLALYERLSQAQALEQAEIEGLKGCPFCDWKCIWDVGEGETRFWCGNKEHCGVISCGMCGKRDHLPKSCDEAEQDKHLDGRHAIEEAMTRALMRNCPKCKKAFIKEEGCNKMTCPNCSTLSCYACRQVITGYDHFDRTPSGHASSSRTAAAGKCLLWDKVEERHAAEVRAAAEKATEEYKRAHPDAQDDEIQVEVPQVLVSPATRGRGRGLGRRGAAPRPRPDYGDPWGAGFDGWRGAAIRAARAVGGHGVVRGPGARFAAAANVDVNAEPGMPYDPPRALVDPFAINAAVQAPDAFLPPPGWANPQPRDHANRPEALVPLYNWRPRAVNHPQAPALAPAQHQRAQRDWMHIPEALHLALLQAPEVFEPVQPLPARVRTRAQVQAEAQLQPPAAAPAPARTRAQTEQQLRAEAWAALQARPQANEEQRQRAQQERAGERGRALAALQRARQLAVERERTEMRRREAERNRIVIGVREEGGA